MSLLFAHLLAQMQESVVLTDAAGIITQVNNAFTHMTGYSQAEAIGQSACFIRSDRHDTRFHQQMWQQLADTGHWYGHIWNRRKNGEVYLQHLDISSIRNSDGRIVQMLGLGQDLSEQHAKQIQAPFFPLEDPLTHLGNRYLLTSALVDAISQAKQRHTSVALIVLDIGRLRVINEELGLAGGDAILRAQANAIKEITEKIDTLVRLQGDMFAIIWPTPGRSLSIAQFAQQLLATLTEPTLVNGTQVHYLQPSVGVALYPRDGLDSVTLLQAAEYAHGIAKFNGRSRFQFVNLRQHERYHRELLIENSLSEALLSGQGLALYYQPQVCPHTHQIHALEALMRWHHPKLGALSPAEFIPLVEQSGQSVALDRWVIQEVCEQIHCWTEQGLTLPCISINLSAKQLEQADFSRWLQECTARRQVTPAQLKLEVTESTLMKPKCVNTLDSVRALGFKVSLDDFGTGYSALASLHKFSFDELKIDHGFMLEASYSERAWVLLKTVASLAQEFSLSLVVEGVETQAQLALLDELGPLTVQGYYFYRPLTPCQVQALLANKEHSLPIINT